MTSRRWSWPIAAVLVTALAAWILNGFLIGTSRGASVDVRIVVHGVVAGAGALVCWTAARSRRDALVGLATAALLVVLSTVLDLGSSLAIKGVPAVWAALTALTVRLIHPDRGQDTSRRPRNARPSVTSSA
jgi:hypothetical protein